VTQKGDVKRQVPIFGPIDSSVSILFIKFRFQIDLTSLNLNYDIGFLNWFNIFRTKVGFKLGPKINILGCLRGEI
jgi:hypothetical protein